MLLVDNCVHVADFKHYYKETYGYEIRNTQVANAIRVLQGTFVSNKEERARFAQIDIIEYDNKSVFKRNISYARRLDKKEFYEQVQDIISVGIEKYKTQYIKKKNEINPFVLYEKYSRRDVSFLMNCENDISSTMYGMKRIEDDVFIFVTYQKAIGNDSKRYSDGKPDYADAFEDNMIFKWDSQIGKGKDSTYMIDVLTAPRKHLFVKKRDTERNFYYVGEFDVIGAENSTKADNKGRMKPITKVTMKMHQSVREDLLKYLQSGLEEKNEEVV